MREKRALQRIREQFQRFAIYSPPRHAQRWTLMPHDQSELLAHALLYLCEWMKIDRAAVFVVDDARETLIARQLVEGKEVLMGEEEIAVMAETPLSRLLAGKKPFLVMAEPTPTAYIPLRAFGHIFGVLRVENVRQKHPFVETDIALLGDFAHELAVVLRALEMTSSEREQLAQMQALHEVSNAIFRSVRLDDMLKAVTQSLLSQLGFDRIRIYLINREGDLLESVLTVDQRGQEAIERESFPLKRGIHPMVDLILGRTDERIEKYQRTIVYLPMRTRDENMGVLMVDNLLSQQEIPPDQITILTAIAGQLGMAIKNARLFQGVEELSITDGLTGLYLMRYFRQRLKEEFYRAERTQSNLSLMILDIDLFKRVNDTYGHLAGDVILSTVAERILGNARKVDLTARYGGDEFVILMPDTAAEEALLLADRLHAALSSEPVKLADGTVLQLTVSIGIATYPTHSTTIDELFKRADEALYWVKSHGRNRSRLYSFEIPAKTPVV